MSKFVDSMMKVFKREKKSQSSVGEGSPRSRRGRKAVLDADSFVFMPGDSNGDLYWGEIINDDNFPSTQRQASRRKTVMSSSSGLQEVNLIIRNRSELSEKDEKMLLNGNLFNRRYSGTLVKAKKAADDDGPVIRDYAFLLSSRERMSQDLSGRYVYDRLIRAPLNPAKSSSPSQQRRMTIVADSQSRDDREKCSLIKNTDLKAKNAPAKCARDGRLLSVPDARTGMPTGHHRPASIQTVGSHNYSDLEWARSIGGSEYAFPADAISWELNIEDVDQYEMLPMKAYRTIAPKDLFLGDKIGEGQFGDVHNGFLFPKTQDEKEVAIKTCKQDASSEDRAKFLEEALVMCKFKHPNIIKLYGVVSHLDLAYIIMELAPHGQLRRYLLVEGVRISRLMLLSYIAQLASALVHLEDMNYVHRDIAARNILVCDPMTVKLADFGLSRGLEDGDYYVASRGKLPIKWMAPESINFRRFTGLSDVWMFGVCCWEILMRGVKPFVGIKNDEVISKIETGERLPLPIECPAPLFSLMNVCWNYDPLDRPRFIEIEARLLDIIEEESKFEQFSTWRFNPDAPNKSVSPIQIDPDAPPKPVRPAGGLEESPPMVHVSSDSSGSRVSHSNDLHRDDDVPPLPPRAMERFRELSGSPPSLRDGSSMSQLNNNIPPPRSIQKTHLRGGGVAEGLPNPSVAPHHVIPPYSVTTISLPDTHPEAPPSSHAHHQPPHSHTHPHDNSLGAHLTLNSHIPPPAILSQHPSHFQQQQQSSSSSLGQRGDPDPDTGIYYSAPQEVMVEKKQQRMLNQHGVFVSREISSPQGSIGDLSSRDGVRPRLGEGRPMSHVSSTEGSSGRSSPAVTTEEKRYNPGQSALGGGGEEQARESFTMPEEDDVLKQTTGVVKTVKELSDKIHKCKPGDYIDLVKNVGLALRDLLGKVDVALGELPSETHGEVSMAQKVLSSDMNQLVSAMKNAQTHYDRFLEQEYQKKMLKAAHVVAVNSKLLLDAVNSARRKAHLMR